MGEQTTWQATVYGPAQTQGSKRIGRAGKSGRPILLDDNRRLRPWRQELTDEMRRCCPRQPTLGPVAVSIAIYVRRPKAHYGTGKNAERLKATAPILPATGKDLDKIARGVLDAGTGVWWRDDDQVCQLSVLRFYDVQERTEVVATPLGELAA